MKYPVNVIFVQGERSANATETFFWMQSCRRNKFVAAFTRDPYSSLASWRETGRGARGGRVERLMHFHFAGDGNGDRQVEVPDDIRMQSAPGVRHKGAGRNDGMG